MAEAPGKTTAAPAQPDATPTASQTAATPQTTAAGTATAPTAGAAAGQTTTPTTATTTPANTVATQPKQQQQQGQPHPGADTDGKQPTQQQKHQQPQQPQQQPQQPQQSQQTLAVTPLAGEQPATGQPVLSVLQLDLPGWTEDHYVAPRSRFQGSRAFAVNVLQSGVASRCGVTGPAWLHITPRYMAIRENHGNNRALAYWPLNCIHRYGTEKYVFSVEVGDLCPQFAGVFYFEACLPLEAFHLLQRHLAQW
eukprot:m.113004 g.113004  ORF g.113004 m.113004 type:complete len:252 (-) comp16215_c0_seq1:176-931(-)